MLNRFACPTIEITAATLAREAGLDGDHLVTRASGRRFRDRLDTVLRQHSQAVILLSLAGVAIMDASFADEAFAALAGQRGRVGGTYGCLVLCGLETTSADNFELAILSRPAREAGLRNCVMPVRDELGLVRLVGKAEEHVRQTFTLLRQQGQLTARDLADRAGLEIGAASTRLKVLYNLGLACRREARDDRGRLYTYVPVG